MKKNREVRVKYSEEEYQRVIKKAEKLAMPLSTYLRTISLIATINPIEVH